MEPKPVDFHDRKYKRNKQYKILSEKVSCAICSGNESRFEKVRSLCSSSVLIQEIKAMEVTKQWKLPSNGSYQAMEVTKQWKLRSP